jgi:hypothetical protein
MIELKHDSLKFSFSEVHPEAQLTIGFKRTLRIPDDGKDYPLPPGLGRFPMKHVDDFSERVPSLWIQHGGVMLPMYQSEALWLSFNSEFLWDHDTSYPFAIKVATGKTNAVTGKVWSDGLQKDPQDYMVSSRQPWLDGYCIEKGVIRQFVAMPLGSGYSAEEQITGNAEHGGIQVIVYPMKRKIFHKRFPKRKYVKDIRYPLRYHVQEDREMTQPCFDMGLTPGGRMRQEIYEDPFGIENWEVERKSRCFIHLANSLVWRAITSDPPPTVPFTSKEYTDYGLPWFDYYSDNSTALKGSEKLNGLKSVVEMGKEKGDNPVPENESVEISNVKKLRNSLEPYQVREGTF